MKMKYLYIAVLILLFTSCKSTKHVVEKTAIKTTTKEKVVSYNDTIFEIPAINTSISIPISKLIEDKKDTVKTSSKPNLNTVEKVFKQQNGRSKVTVKISDGILTATSDCDSIALRAKIRSEVIKELSNSTQTTTERKTIRTGHSTIKVIFYCLACFCIGATATYLLKTFKII